MTDQATDDDDDASTSTEESIPIDISRIKSSESELRASSVHVQLAPMVLDGAPIAAADARRIGRSRRTIGPGADRTVKIDKNGKPVVETNAGTRKQKSKYSVSFIWTYLVDYTLSQIVDLIYFLLMRYATINHRKQYIDTDYEYRLEVISTYARKNLPRFAAYVGLVVAAFIGYLLCDAFLFHTHGLEIVYVPPTMSNVSFDARAALNASDLLALYPSDDTLKVSFSLTHRDQFETMFDSRTLLWKTAQFLRENRGREHCCCAPMFGFFVNHYAFESESLTRAPAKDVTLTTDSCENKEIGVVHLINLRDTMDVEYDQLSAQSNESALAALGPLARVAHNQAHLFAWPPQPASVAVVRRKTVRFRAMDFTGKETLIEVSNEQAYCLSECYDLINGQSVYARARLQRARGLNI
jgi:hypothetical protein